MDQWNKLPKSYQAIVTSACLAADITTTAKYDADNPAALRRLVANGTQLRPFSKDILEACYKAAYELYSEETARNPKFAKVYEPWKHFRSEEDLWFRVEEQQFDNFILSHALPVKS
jgi:TRAP-type mannitol/chloroaromatic compound transport system substrate-binding protein